MPAMVARDRPWLPANVLGACPTGLPDEEVT